MASARERRAWWRRLGRSEDAAGWMLAGPAVFLVGVFAIFPIAWSVVLSLQSRNLLTGEGRWVGWANYEALAADSVFKQALSNSLKYTPSSCRSR
jgi:multiple sugar transport system permease protein